MKLVLSFLKPHWKMCLLTVFLLLVDVVGALIIPTFAAELMNEAGKNMPIDTLITTAVLMGVAALIAGAASIGSVFAAFGGYAITSIKANRRFAMLDGISFFAINILIILVYTLSGFRISAGAFYTRLSLFNCLSFYHTKKRLSTVLCQKYEQMF